MTDERMMTYRAGYAPKRFFETIEEAARYVKANGGPIDRRTGKVYRTISGREQDAAVAAVRDAETDRDSE